MPRLDALLPLFLLAACPTGRPDAARIVAAELTQLRVFGPGDATPRTITGRVELERLAGCLCPASRRRRTRPAWRACSAPTP